MYCAASRIAYRIGGGLKFASKEVELDDGSLELLAHRVVWSLLFPVWLIRPITALREALTGRPWMPALPAAA